ncbi:uncharacterized protein N7515_000047 [Penicillium bovifimosum]|uniref:BZIP domain-containing protein n=1 Tax=Penicillium bovifimosum TaxID=126998 RepID=A0A9W9HEX8_9EURO|nr:uncharacterized protein N7515_000047 [Penicillium bovifimosum]KAJ5145483.1 hypothetical protein N7515_000047 [Penicillium bovifimosum]
MSSAEKKRLRDRRSQQTLRDKKQRHAAELEEKVAHCEQHHSDQGVQRLLQVIQGLREQNETLRCRQNSLKSLVSSWETEQEELPVAADSNHDWSSLYKEMSNREAQFSLQTDPNISILHGRQGIPSLLNDPLSAAATPPQIHSPSLEPVSSASWSQIPSHSDDLATGTEISCPWFAYLDQITPCPDSPSSPLDMLYGTKTNPLADMIHSALQRRPIRDPERLGFGWVIYHYSRWILRPTPETFARLPEFLRPVQGQMTIRHPMILDIVPWPRMRLNLIRRWHLYADERDDLFGMFACCVRIRWPWGERILERDERNELCIKKEFYDTFMRLGGWGAYTGVH